MSELSALDIRFLVKELKQLEGGVVQKIYQYGPGSREFLFEVFVPRRRDAGPQPAPGGRHLLAFGPGTCYLASEKPVAPSEPPMFAMFLRKHFLGKRVVAVRQLGFDRIVELVGEEGSVVVELLPPGNVIVLDQEGRIVMPLEVQHWKDREVKPKEPYRPPPGPVDPFAADFHEFYRALRASGKKVGAWLATSGFGPAYANELCRRAGIEGAVPAAEIGAGAAERLLEEIRRIEPLPAAHGSGAEAAPSLSAAYEQAFSAQKAAAAAAEKEQRVAELRAKAAHIVEQQERVAASAAAAAAERKAGARALYSEYGTVAAVLGTIQRLRERHGWPELKQELARLPEGKVVREIREQEGKVVVELGGKRVELDLRRSVEENAALLFEAAKRARAKATGALAAKQVQEVKLQELLQKEAPAQALPAVAARKLRARWYERYAWFRTSDGFLVVAGTSAAANERLLAKYVGPHDIVFHADIAGAGFVVVKRERPISEIAMKEASEFAAVHSKAWGRGLGKMDVYAVAPSQLSKSPPPGEYLPKGAFAVSGQRRWFRGVELKLAIGVALREGRVIAGPVMAVRAHADYFVTIVPGSTAAGELAKAVKRKLLIKARPEHTAALERVAVDDIAHLVPGGAGDLMEWA